MNTYETLINLLYGLKLDNFVFEAARNDNPTISFASICTQLYRVPLSLKNLFNLEKIWCNIVILLKIKIEAQIFVDYNSVNFV